MQPSNIKIFKIDTIDPAATPPSATPPAQSDLEQDNVSDFFENILGDVPAEDRAADGSDSSSLLDDYVKNISTPPAAEQEMLDRMASFPPSVEEILMQDIRAKDYLDVLKQRYITLQTKVEDLEAQLNASLSSGELTTAEIAQTTKMLELIPNMKIKIAQQIETCDRDLDDQQRSYDDELKTFTCNNGDNWIGRPYDESSFRLYIDGDGVTRYLDSTGKEVQPRIMDPEYISCISNNNALLVITAQEASGNPDALIMEGEDKEPDADIYCRINGNNPGDNKFHTTLDMGVPEYFWCKEEDGETICPADSFITDAAGRLIQPPPEDKTKWREVPVTEVIVRSEDNGLTTEDGTDLQNTYIEYYAQDGTKLLTVRIEGYSSTADDPAAAKIKGSDEYFTGSTNVSLHIGAANRMNPVKLDGSGYRSYCRHIVGERGTIQRLFEILAPIEEVADAATQQGVPLAFTETTNLFEGTSFQTTTWERQSGDGTTGTGAFSMTIDHPDSGGSFGIAAAYGSCLDRYVGDVMAGRGAYEDDPVQSYANGLFITGLRGQITGTQDNDCIVAQTLEMESYPEYCRDNIPPNMKLPEPGDALYNMSVDGGGGNNIIIQQGRGSLYAQNFSFAWVEATSDDFIAIEAARGNSALSDSDLGYSVRDPKNFVHVEGAGEGRLYDLREIEDNDDADYEQMIKNDYYDFDVGEFRTDDAGDSDIVGFERLNEGSNEDGIENEEGNLFDVAADAVLEALSGLNALDPTFIPPTFEEDTSPLSGTSAATALNDEMNSFFDTVFSEADDFWGSEGGA